MHVYMKKRQERLGKQSLVSSNDDNNVIVFVIRALLSRKKTTKKRLTKGFEDEFQTFSRFLTKRTI
jgi:hypothetical protein